MKTFSLEKNGYSKLEVENFVNEVEYQSNDYTNKIKSLNEEIKTLKECLNYYKERENIISKSIESAVVAGEMIKESNKQVFKQQIESLKSLQVKWSNFLDEVKKQYPNALISTRTDSILKSLSDAIDEVLCDKKSQNDKNIKTIEKSCQNLVNQKTIISNAKSGKKDNYKNIIMRNKRPSPKTLVEDEVEREYQKETKRLNTFSLQKMYEKDNYGTDKENFIDEFLNNKNSNSQNYGYEKEILKNKNQDQNTGFSLKEAVKPTMDLSEIMKSFDLDE